MKKKLITVIVILVILLAGTVWLLVSSRQGISRAELESGLAAQTARLESKLDARCDILEEKLDRVESKLDRLDAKLDRLIELATPALPDSMSPAGDDCSGDKGF